MNCPYRTNAAHRWMRPDKAADACLPRPRSGPGPVGRGVFERPVREDEGCINGLKGPGQIL